MLFRSFVDLDPEFDDHGTPVGQLLLEFINLVVSTFPVVLAAEAFQTLLRGQHHHRRGVDGCNGGGHLTMAAAQLKDVTLEEAKQQLEDVLQQMREDGDI